MVWAFTSHRSVRSKWESSSTQSRLEYVHWLEMVFVFSCSSRGSEEFRRIIGWRFSHGQRRRHGTTIRHCIHRKWTGGYSRWSQFVSLIIVHVCSHLILDSIPGWCRSRRVQPFRKNAHKYSDYIINLVRGKALDTSQRGYLSNELVQWVLSVLEISLLGDFSFPLDVSS